ncbi:FAD dependent oxidoreductase-like protein superfamily [Neolentinus lepideus HHB14362 ss-1]|uniref:FAD dependent oxidoreductase-like protein superfamily n=1 Tax=Neolentinus lepideus HHB14362 ss-1 TaxID=1314782 RepID=A0A165SF99_9AGAM|nr:FAD dependent oxidoreductase-like protein superfamily [Neolentinus lepideus HHB14362 ss-1]
MPTTVILGAGIIGLSTAYYLSTSSSPTDHTIHIVDSSPALFASASGKAAGFLAADWFAASSASLGRLSFDLHKQLAEEHGGREKWGYSPSVSYSLESTKGVEKGEDWLSAGASRASVVSQGREGTSGPVWLTHTGKLRQISQGDTTAQVDPLRLCEFLLAQCKSRGVQLHHPANATKILTTDSALTGIQITHSPTQETLDLACDSLVLACGAWTTLAYRTLFPSSSRAPHISSLAGHSVVLKSAKWSGTPEEEANGCHAVFTTHPSGFSPEIFSRVGGDIWLGGLNDSSLSLPELATGVKIDRDSIKTLVDVGKWLCGDEVEVLREGLCHRPVTKTGVPFVGKIDEQNLGEGIKGRVFVASGHGPWGISLSLGTGKVVSELVVGKETSADISLLGRL